MTCITVQLGQYGNQLGAQFFKLLSEQASSDLLLSDQTFFRSSSSTLVPRSVLIDLEPKVVEQVRTCETSTFQFDSSNFFSSSSGASNNWAIGYASGEGQEAALNLIRREIERAPSVSSLLLFQSLAGGTGSGLGSAVVEALADTYQELKIIAQTVFPFSFGEVIVHSLNATLSLSKLLDSTDGVITTSNDVISEIAGKILHIKNPSFSDLNGIISNHLASILCPGDDTISFNSLVDSVFFSPYYKLASVFVNPIVPTRALEFTNDKWSALINQQINMIKNDNLIGGVSRSFGVGNYVSAAGNLWGTGSGDASSSAQECFTSNQSNWSRIVKSCTFGSSNHNLIGVDKMLGTLVTSSHQSKFLENISDRASLLINSGAYLHHYQENGMEKEDLLNAIAVVESFKNRYKNL
ncbi:hypothetical protein RCL1_002515 [Eukaryota sp. TZLM3-RCL]